MQNTTFSTLRTIRPEDIPEEYQDILETLGMDSFLELIRLCGGQTLYLPKLDSLEREGRDREIRARFNGGSSAFAADLISSSAMFGFDFFAVSSPDSDGFFSEAAFFFFFGFFSFLGLAGSTCTLTGPIRTSTFSVSANAAYAPSRRRDSSHNTIRIPSTIHKNRMPHHLPAVSLSKIIRPPEHPGTERFPVYRHR